MRGSYHPQMQPSVMGLRNQWVNAQPPRLGEVVLRQPLHCFSEDPQQAGVTVATHWCMFH